MNPAANHCPLPKFALWSLALDSVRQMFRPCGPLFPRNPFFPALRSGHRLFQRPSPGKQFPSSQNALVLSMITMVLGSCGLESTQTYPGPQRSPEEVSRIMFFSDYIEIDGKPRQWAKKSMIYAILPGKHKVTVDMGKSSSTGGIKEGVKSTYPVTGVCSFKAGHRYSIVYHMLQGSDSRATSSGGFVYTSTSGQYEAVIHDTTGAGPLEKHTKFPIVARLR